MADRVDPAGRVYANALHQAATEAGKVQDVDRDLEGFISALGENEVLLRALVNPALPREAKRRVLARVLDQADPLARNAVLVLADHGRLELLVDMQTAESDQLDSHSLLRYCDDAKSFLCSHRTNRPIRGGRTPWVSRCGRWMSTVSIAR